MANQLINSNGVITNLPFPVTRLGQGVAALLNRILKMGTHGIPKIKHSLRGTHNYISSDSP